MEEIKSDVKSIYNILVKNDGSIFRVPHYLTSTESFLESEYLIVSPNSKGKLRNKYFDSEGELKMEYCALKRIIE